MSVINYKIYCITDLKVAFLKGNVLMDVTILCKEYGIHACTN
jgi:hypothetical protein